MDRILTGTTELMQSLLLKNANYWNIPQEYFKYFQFLPLFILFFVLAIFLTPLIGRLALKYNIVDNPSEKRLNNLNRHDDPKRHMHKESVPFLGGLAVLLPFVILLPFLIRFDAITLPFYIAVIVLIVNGILDDKYNLPPQIQIIFHLIASFIIVFSVADLPFVNNPLGGTINLNWFQTEFEFLHILWRLILPGDLLIIPWILLCINALKWIGGSDGLLEGNMIIAFLLMAVLGFRANIASIAVISIMLAGGISGFLYFNYPPAKIFSGSTGKTTFGFIIAVLAIMKGAKVAATIIILALPLIDAAFVLVKRYFKYKPKSLIELMRINDTNHIHHQFIKMGFSAKKILLLEVTVSLLLGAIAVLTTGAFKLFALIFSLLIISAGILLINLKAQKTKDTKQKEHDKKSPESKYSY